ncbi:MAG: YajD family HNH nuclease [Thermodesulfobacteriota bacterium]
MKNEEYRKRALQLLPWVCAKCGREFSGKKLHELTVHHRDHDYRNNPPDGSNWELLCMYCHDNEHARGLESEWLAGQERHGEKEPGARHTPFAELLRRTEPGRKGKKG